MQSGELWCYGAVWWWGACLVPETSSGNETTYFVASGRFFTFHYVYNARSHAHQINLISSLTATKPIVDLCNAAVQYTVRN
jgi:hypothetical protein